MTSDSPTRVGVAIFILAGLTCAFAGALRANGPTKADSKAVAIRKDGLAKPRAEMEKRITSAPARVMKAGGLAGAV